MKQEIANEKNIFIQMELKKKQHLEKKGVERLKYDKYHPDGTKTEAYSFYDPIKGAAGRTKLFTKALEKAAVQSENFNQTLQNLRNTLNYSNLQIDFEKLDKKIPQKRKDEGLRSHRWRKFDKKDSYSPSQELKKKK